MKNIFLIGMPSSGKTTLGKKLARHTRYRFIDTDQLIVKQEGMSIANIFAEQGEDYFRQVEADVLRAIRPDSKLIVSTGGGMPCFHDNMAYIKAHGMSLFLDVPVYELVARIRRHHEDDRPLYQKEDDKLEETMRQKHKQRLPYYTQADFIIPTTASVKDILQILEPYLSL